MKAIVPFLILALVLAGCGHGGVRDPAPDALVDAVEPFGRPNLRAWGDALRPDKVAAFISAATAGMKARCGPEIAAGRTPRADHLALSGGGQYGAFGAGILNAWAKSGARPVFADVSGISTGAIIAPFAVHGPEYDATPREIYSKHDTAQVFILSRPTA